MSDRNTIHGQMKRFSQLAGIAKNQTWNLPPSDPRKSKNRERRLFEQIMKACPSLSKRVAAAVAADLSDILEVGQTHEYFVRRFLRLKFPEDSNRLQGLLISWIDVQLLFHCQWHLKSLRHRLPKVLRATRNGHVARTKS